MYIFIYSIIYGVIYIELPVYTIDSTAVLVMKGSPEFIGRESANMSMRWRRCCDGVTETDRHIVCVCVCVKRKQSTADRVAYVCVCFLPMAECADRVCRQFTRLDSVTNSAFYSVILLPLAFYFIFYVGLHLNFSS